jgi:hypothetical protein
VALSNLSLAPAKAYSSVQFGTDNAQDHFELNTDLLFGEFVENGKSAVATGRSSKEKRQEGGESGKDDVGELSGDEDAAGDTTMSVLLVGWLIGVDRDLAVLATMGP